MAKALAIQHVSCEDLGLIEPELAALGVAVETVHAAQFDFARVGPTQYALVVVLGGPMGVYETERFSFLPAEIALVRARLAARRPTLGICLGAQIMAAALGTRVYAGTNGKEIGWAPIQPGEDVKPGSPMAQLLASGQNVFHWHGDTFDLPPGAHRLARTKAYPNQAFLLGDYALGLQFHLEVTAEGLERWYVEHAGELARENLSVERLRAASQICGPALAPVAQAFWRNWLRGVLKN